MILSVLLIGLGVGVLGGPDFFLRRLLESAPDPVIFMDVYQGSEQSQWLGRIQNTTADQRNFRSIDSVLGTYFSEARQRSDPAGDRDHVRGAAPPQLGV